MTMMAWTTRMISRMSRWVGARNSPTTSTVDTWSLGHEKPSIGSHAYLLMAQVRVPMAEDHLMASCRESAG